MRSEDVLANAETFLAKLHRYPDGGQLSRWDRMAAGKTPSISCSGALPESVFEVLQECYQGNNALARSQLRHGNHGHGLAGRDRSLRTAQSQPHEARWMCGCFTIGSFKASYRDSGKGTARELAGESVSGGSFVSSLLLRVAGSGSVLSLSDFFS